MPSQSMIRSIKIFLITATFLGCSHSSFSQQFIPPIDMTLTEFNKGRPENFYYLAEASEGQDQVCEVILGALNEPYPAEPNVGKTELYSKYLLRSRLSVPWVEIPFYGRSVRSAMYDSRYTSVDIDNNGEEEDFFVLVSTLSGLPVHRFVYTKKGILPVAIKEISTSMWTTILESGAGAAERELSEQLELPLLNVYQDYNFLNPTRYAIYNRYVDVVEVKAENYILFTASTTFPERRDTFAVRLNADEAFAPICRFTSRYRVLNLQ